MKWGPTTEEKLSAQRQKILNTWNEWTLFEKVAFVFYAPRQAFLCWWWDLTGPPQVNPPFGMRIIHRIRERFRR